VSTRDHLTTFLESTLPQLALAERREADVELTSRNIVLYGSGKFGQYIARGLRKTPVTPATFVDANESRQGTECCGLPVLSPLEAISRYGESHIFVVTVWRNYLKLEKQLKTSGARHVRPFLPFLWRHAEALLPYYNHDLPSRMLSQKRHIYEAFDLFEEEHSRREFLFQLQWMLSLEAAEIPPCSPLNEQYFPSDIFSPSRTEVLIDAGAFDGDTIQEFLFRTQNQFDKILAFEPDPDNWRLLNSFVATLPTHLREKIRLYPVGLGARREVLRFDASGSVSSAISASGGTEIQVMSLDEILQDVSPTYIKMDIEGAELDALAGGATIIARSRPKLAACVYHKQSHLWEIPIQFKRLSRHYRLYLRRYRDEFGDVVCYAVPGEQALP